jgi:hypothetical protein
MDLHEIEEFKRAASECSALAAKTTEADRKASLQDLAWSYHNLAYNLKLWAGMAAAERIILDAARASLLEKASDFLTSRSQATPVIPSRKTA